MTTDIKLNTETWDYDLTSNGLELFEKNPNVVAQRIRIAYQLKQGELFTDVIEGVPIVEFSATKDGGSFADAFMIDYTSKIEGVVEVINFTSRINPVTRVYEPTVEVRTDSGDILTIDGGTL